MRNLLTDCTKAVGNKLHPHTEPYKVNQHQAMILLAGRCPWCRVTEDAVHAQQTRASEDQADYDFDHRG